jgi:hypothetical protein
MTNNDRRLTSLFALPDDRSFLFRNGWGHGLADDLLYRSETGRANLIAVAASNTFVLVDDVDLVLAADDPLFRALPEANQAGFAQLRIDVV